FQQDRSRARTPGARDLSGRQSSGRSVGQRVEGPARRRSDDAGAEAVGDCSGRRRRGHGHFRDWLHAAVERDRVGQGWHVGRRPGGQGIRGNARRHQEARRAPDRRLAREAALAMRLTFVFAALILASFQASPQTPLTLVGAIDLPRVEGRIDHLAVDLAAQRLYVAALGNNTVEVVDLKTGAVMKSVPGFHEPQGVQAIPDAKSVAVANGQSGSVQWLDDADYHFTR